MMEPLGASQVLSYLFKLSEDYQYYLISLEKPTDLLDTEGLNKLKLEIAKYGIVWLPITYQSSFTGKRINFYNFLKKAHQTVKSEKIKYLHCRSYLPTLAAYLIQKVQPIKYLFDTRGFDIDERADTGSLSRAGVTFKGLKWLEKKLYVNASSINKLSLLGKNTILNNELFKGGDEIKNISVIPTCVDLERFKFHIRNYDKPITIGYVGTAIGWYDFDKTMKTLELIAKNIAIKFLVFNGGQHEFIKEKIRAYDIDEAIVQIEKVSFQEMPNRLKEVDIALFFIHPFFSKIASAATKLGEFFASGIPVLTNAGVGDHEFLIDKYKTGKILDFEQIDTYNFSEIFNQLLTIATAKQCRLLAEEYFSLDKGVTAYRESYAEAFV